MSCGCRKNKKPATEVEVNNIAKTEPNKTSAQIAKDVDAVMNALDIGLTQCYLCCKKHIGRAQAFFEEYHNGYPNHVKNLVDSLFEAETEIHKAFQLWQKVQSQLDMAAGELLGNSVGGRQMQDDHVTLAAKIREERLKFDQNPLYIPDFDRLKYLVHALQHRIIAEENKL